MVTTFEDARVYTIGPAYCTKSVLVKSQSEFELDAEGGGDRWLL